jgi:hypothetical protein
MNKQTNKKIQNKKRLIYQDDEKRFGIVRVLGDDGAGHGVQTGGVGTRGVAPRHRAESAQRGGRVETGKEQRRVAGSVARHDDVVIMTGGDEARHNAGVAARARQRQRRVAAGGARRSERCCARLVKQRRRHHLLRPALTRLQKLLLLHATSKQATKGGRVAVCCTHQTKPVCTREISTDAKSQTLQRAKEQQTPVPNSTDQHELIKCSP